MLVFAMLTCACGATIQGGECLTPEGAVRLAREAEVLAGHGLSMSVELAPATEESVLELRLRISDAEDGKLYLSQVHVLGSSDCRFVPDLVHVVVARFLHDLPEESWRRPVEPSAQAPQPVAQRPAEPAAETWRLRLTGRVGLGAARAQGLLITGELGAGAELVHETGTRVSLGARGTFGEALVLGPGAARVTSLAVGLGVHHSLSLGPLAVTPGALFYGGGQLAGGAGFSKNMARLLPFGSVAAGLAVGPAGLPVAAELHVEMLLGVARLHLRGEGSSIEYPSWRVGLSLTFGLPSTLGDRFGADRE